MCHLSHLHLLNEDFKMQLKVLKASKKTMDLLFPQFLSFET